MPAVVVVGVDGVVPPELTRNPIRQSVEKKRDQEKETSLVLSYTRLSSLMSGEAVIVCWQNDDGN